MEKIKVIVNGLPGKMARAIAEAVIDSLDMELIPRSLTGPETVARKITIRGLDIKLFRPDEISKLITDEIPDITIDFTLPSAVKQNVDFYAKMKLPFVLGTSGDHIDYITEKVAESGIKALVAPNMAKPIVVFQAMMEFAASNFPGALNDFNLLVIESHQKTKVDTSKTAKTMVGCFNKLGIPFQVDQIIKKRTEEDYWSLSIPRKYWEGHGWHTYCLSSGDVSLEFTHNVNGRKVYVDGTLSAVRFLFKKENVGHVYSMIDVLMAG